jgi:hypothetical protein
MRRLFPVLCPRCGGTEARSHHRPPRKSSKVLNKISSKVSNKSRPRLDFRSTHIVHSQTRERDLWFGPDSPPLPRAVRTPNPSAIPIPVLQRDGGILAPHRIEVERGGDGPGGRVGRGGSGRGDHVGVWATSERPGARVRVRVRGRVFEEVEKRRKD